MSGAWASYFATKSLLRLGLNPKGADDHQSKLSHTLPRPKGRAAHRDRDRCFACAKESYARPPDNVALPRRAGANNIVQFAVVNRLYKESPVLSAFAYASA